MSAEHIVRTFHDIKYIGSFPVKNLDQDNRDDFVRIALKNSSIDSFSVTLVSLVVTFEGIQTYYSESKSLHMMHALRRISLATCDPERSQFGFVAREPKQQWNQQLCHLFLTNTPKEAEQLNHVVGEVFRLVYRTQLSIQNQSKQFDTNRIIVTDKVNKYALCSTPDNFVQLNPEGDQIGKSLDKINDENFNELIDFQESAYNNNNNDTNSAKNSSKKSPMKYLLSSSYNQTLKKLNCVESDNDDENCPLFNQKNDVDLGQDPASSSFFNIVQNLNCKRMSSTDSNSSSSAATSSTVPVKSSSSSSSLGKAGQSSSPIEKGPGLYPDELNNLKKASWFQAGIPREISVDVLKREPIGSFIVRESTTKTGCYALSLRVPKSYNALGIVHYLILHSPKGYKIKGFTKEFSSLTSLIIHHSVMQELLPCPLLLPKSNVTKK